jgi:large subunit ribosomal protein L13
MRRRVDRRRENRLQWWTLLRRRGFCVAATGIELRAQHGAKPAAYFRGAGSRNKLANDMKTFSARAQDVVHDWYVVDATDRVLGRLASQIALRLRGKHKPIYTPHVDTGDFIVVTNVDKIKVTGNKAEDKLYHRHSGYPGGIRTTNFSKMQERFPGRALEKAVKGMLPKGPLGYAMIKKLKYYAGDAHPHSAQQPKPLDIDRK